MRRVLFSLLVALLPSFARAEEKPGCGTVEALEVTSLTRTKLTASLYTTLPRAADGRQEFTGEIAVANTPIPLGPSLTATALRGPAGEAVVLLVDLDLAQIPQALLGRVRPPALDVTLKGTLSRAGEAPVRVCAAGVLRIGSQQIRSAGAMGGALARFSGARFTGFSLTEVEGQATATFFNPLSFPLDVKSLVYDLWAGDRKVAGGERHDLRLNAGRENAIDLPISAASAELLPALANAVAGDGRAAGRLVAQVSLRVGKDQILTIPLDLPGSVQVLP